MTALVQNVTPTSHLWLQSTGVCTRNTAEEEKEEEEEEYEEDEEEEEEQDGCNVEGRIGAGLQSHHLREQEGTPLQYSVNKMESLLSELNNSRASLPAKAGVH